MPVPTKLLMMLDVTSTVIGWNVPRDDARRLARNLVEEAQCMAKERGYMLHEKTDWFYADAAKMRDARKRRNK